jgi:hypothetical protein
LERLELAALRELVAVTRDGTAARSGTDTDSRITWSGCARGPADGLYATFRVGTETFRQHITSAAGIQGALALWKGTSNAGIPVGTLSCKCTGWNCEWDFHMEPESITFAHDAIELCDGTPSYVNSHCAEFGGGSYCPWSAQLTVLRDCRTNPLCPLVPR